MKPRRTFVAGEFKTESTTASVEVQSADAVTPEGDDYGWRTFLIWVVPVLVVLAGFLIVPTQYAAWRDKRIESALCGVHRAAHNLAQSEHYARDDSSAKASVDYSRDLEEMEKAENLAYKVGGYWR